MELKKKEMITTPRFENAIQKLYHAFTNGQLHPEYCHQCAVGNILGNTDSWQHLTDYHGSGKLNYVGIVNQNFGKRFAGYSPAELLKVEIAFLKGCEYQLPLKPASKKPENPKDPDLLFNGLCAVISYLCEIDNIPNVVDFTKTFENELKGSSEVSATRYQTI